MNLRKTARFQSLTDAARFYGVSRRGFFAFKAAGVKAGDPLPYDSPEEMPGWFERRGRPCPLSVLDRASAEGASAAASPAGTSRARKRVPAAKALAPNGCKPAVAAPDVPGVQLVLGEEGTLDDIRSGQRKLHAALARRYEQFIREGEQESGAALAVYRRLEGLESRILAWLKVQDRGDEWMLVADVRAAAQEFAAGVERLFRRQLPMEVKPEERDGIQAAVDRLAAKLPQLLPAALQGAA